MDLTPDLFWTAVALAGGTVGGVFGGRRLERRMNGSNGNVKPCSAVGILEMSMVRLESQHKETRDLVLEVHKSTKEFIRELQRGFTEQITELRVMEGRQNELLATALAEIRQRHP